MGTHVPLRISVRKYTGQSSEENSSGPRTNTAAACSLLPSPDIILVHQEEWVVIVREVGLKKTKTKIEEKGFDLCKLDQKLPLGLSLRHVNILEDRKSLRSL